MKIEDLGGRFAYEEVLKVETVLVKCNEGVLANRTDSEHLLELIRALLHLYPHCCNYNLRFVRAESNNDFLLLFGSEYTYKTISEKRSNRVTTEANSIIIGNLPCVRFKEKRPLSWT